MRADKEFPHPTPYSNQCLYIFTYIFYIFIEWCTFKLKLTKYSRMCTYRLDCRSPSMMSAACTRCCSVSESGRPCLLSSFATPMTSSTPSREREREREREKCSKSWKCFHYQSINLHNLTQKIPIEKHGKAQFLRAKHTRLSDSRGRRATFHVSEGLHPFRASGCCGSTQYDDIFCTYINGIVEELEDNISCRLYLGDLAVRLVFIRDTKNDVNKHILSHATEFRKEKRCI